MTFKSQTRKVVCKPLKMDSVVFISVSESANFVALYIPFTYITAYLLQQQRHQLVLSVSSISHVIRYRSIRFTMKKL